MIRVILWGCGNAGRNTYNIIKQGMKEYNVIAFGDTYNVKINKELGSDAFYFRYGKVLGYYDVKTLYETGKIDGVIICITDKGNYSIVEENMSIMGIPIYTLDNTRMSAFSCAEYKYQILAGKLDVAVLSDVDIIVNPNIVNAMPYSYMVYKNKVLWESDRFLTHSKFSFGFPMVYPVRQYDLYLEKACSLLFLGTREIYGHFIFACLNKIYAFENANYDGKYLLYESKFIRKWMRLLQEFMNIDEERIIYVDGESFKAVRVNELHCSQNIVDAGKLNATILCDFSKYILSCSRMKWKYKLSPIYTSNTEEKYCAELFNPSGISKNPEFLYVKRSETCERRLSPTVETIIETYGFKTIVPEIMPIEIQIEYFRHAKVVIAAHGSNVANMIFMQKGSYLIELFDSSFVDLFYVECAKKIGVHYRMIVSQNEWHQLIQDEIIVHPEALKSTIEEVIKLTRMDENKHESA